MSAEENFKDIEMNYNLVKKAIGEMTSSKSKDSNGISKETLINIQDTIIPTLVKFVTYNSKRERCQNA